jgi:AAHS family 4-hydroxybenzoate transporter-like MFS transporter
MTTDTLEAGAATRSHLNAAERRILVICFFTAMVDGFDTLILAFIAPLVGKAFGMSPAEIGKLFAINFVGAVIGGLGFGPLADRFGRRTMLLVSLALAVVFTLLCSLAGSPRELMTLRFLAGLGLGGVIPMIIALTAESMPPPLRTASVTWMFLGIPFGAVVGGAIVAATLSYGWPAIFVGGGVAAALLIPAVFFGLPESLMTPAAIGSTDARHGLFASVPAQFAEGRFAAVLCLWLGAFSVILSSFFLLNWMPSVLAGSGFSPERAAFGGVLLNLGGVVGALIISIAVPRAGPYWPVIVLLCCGGAVVWLVGQQVGAEQGMLPLVFLAGVGVFGAQLAMPAIAAELFPLAVRGAGVGWAMGIGRTASIVAPVIGGALIAAQVPWPTLFLVVAVPVFVAALAIFLANRVMPSGVLLPASVQPTEIKW